MPIPLGSVTVGASGVVTVYAGTPGTVGAVAIYNESPYAINASAGAGGLPIMAQTVDILYTDTGGFSGNITLTTSDYLSNANDAPSFIVFLAVYQPGEPIRGTYPAPLMRLAAGSAIVSNSPANAFEQDFLTPFVLSGLVASKDGSVANQLDVTAGIAFVRQTDNSIGRVAPIASTQLTSAHSSTYYLDLNPDGSWSFATSHSVTPNYLAIAQCTTDASGNIATVTDERALNTSVFSGYAPGMYFPAQIEIGPLTGSVGATANMGTIYYSSGGGALVISPTRAGTNQGVVIQGWAGASYNALGVGADGIATETTINHLGVFTSIASQATAGSFGVPVIVAQAINTHVTVTTQQTILSFTPSANGLYRVSGFISFGNSSSASPTFGFTWTDPNLGGPTADFTFAGSPTVINGGTAFNPNTSAPTYPITIYAGTGGAITVHYTDPSGAPNDYVTALIERIS